MSLPLAANTIQDPLDIAGRAPGTLGLVAWNVSSVLARRPRLRGVVNSLAEGIDVRSGLAGQHDATSQVLLPMQADPEVKNAPVTRASPGLNSGTCR